MNFKYRYPGAKPFTTDESSIFFGRRDDTDKLFEQLQFQKHIVLHARSGIGKSSLVSAGLIPYLSSKEGCECVSARFGFYKDGSDAPKDQLIKIFQEQTTDSNNTVFKKLENFKNTLWFAAKKMQSIKDANDQRFFIFFDQFEELFSYPEEMISGFKQSLSDLLLLPIPYEIKGYIYEKINSDSAFFSDDELDFLFKTPDFRALFVVRSDSLSRIDILTDSFPVLLKYLYELYPLNEKQCKEAITEPARLSSPSKLDEDDNKFISPCFSFTDEAVKHILNALTRNQDGKIIPVETNQLQWVLEYCEKIIIDRSEDVNEEKGKYVLSPKDIGDINNIIDNYFFDILDEFSDEGKQAVELMLEENFIIGSNRVPVADLTIQAKNIKKEWIEHLVNRHIVRAEPNRLGGISYELSHDTLVKPILDLKEKHLKNEEKKRIILEQKEKELQLNKQVEKEREERIKERKERINQQRQLRKTRLLLAFSVAALIVALLFMFIAYNAKQDLSDKKKELELKQKEEKKEKYKRYWLQSDIAAKNNDYSRAMTFLELAKEFAPDSLSIDSIENKILKIRNDSVTKDTLNKLIADIAKCMKNDNDIELLRAQTLCNVALRLEIDTIDKKEIYSMNIQLSEKINQKFQSYIEVVKSLIISAEGIEGSRAKIFACETFCKAKMLKPNDLEIINLLNNQKNKLVLDKCECK